MALLKQALGLQHECRQLLPSATKVGEERALSQVKAMTCHLMPGH